MDAGVTGGGNRLAHACTCTGTRVLTHAHTTCVHHCSPGSLSLPSREHGPQTQPRMLPPGGPRDPVPWLGRGVTGSLASCWDLPGRLGWGPAGPGVLWGRTGVRVMQTPPSELPGTFWGAAPALGSPGTCGSISSGALDGRQEVSRERGGTPAPDTPEAHTPPEEGCLRCTEADAPASWDPPRAQVCLCTPPLQRGTCSGLRPPWAHCPDQGGLKRLLDPPAWGASVGAAPSHGHITGGWTHGPFQGQAH